MPLRFTIRDLLRLTVVVALVAIALAIAVAIAVPLAMLHASDDSPSAPMQHQLSQMPKDKMAKSLFIMWQKVARQNGDIPGGLVGLLGEKVKEFIRNNTGDHSGDAYAKKMEPLVPRFDSTRDWTPAKVVALLDDIATVTTIPLKTTMDQAAERHNSLAARH